MANGPGCFAEYAGSDDPFASRARRDGRFAGNAFGQHLSHETSATTPECAAKIDEIQCRAGRDKSSPLADI
jgi:hypothetical protein